MEAMAHTFKLLWHTKRGFKVCDRGDHRDLFVFSDESDIDKVLLGEPWSFDKSLVALKKVRQHTKVKGLLFDKACFWKQVHDLPLRCLNMGVATDINVAAVGEVVVNEEKNDDYEGSQFMRVQVSVDITKPLCRGRKIGLSNGEDS